MMTIRKPPYVALYGTQGMMTIRKPPYAALYSAQGMTSTISFKTGSNAIWIHKAPLAWTLGLEARWKPLDPAA